MAKFDNTSNTRSSRKYFRLVITVFSAVIIVLVVVSIAVLLTQEPVNHNGDEKNLRISFVENTDNNASTHLHIRRGHPNYRKFTFEDLFSSKMFVKESYATLWTRNGGLVLAKNEYFESSSTATLVQPGTFDAVECPMDASLVRTMSSNRKYAYITQNTKQIFHHSNEELYQVFRIMNGTRIGDSFAVGPKGDGFETIHSLEWNPNPNKNDFVFVHDYNIYYQDDPEKRGSAVKLTSDGNYLLRYGVPDWLYEEEILSSGDAIWWADSGDYVAYLKFDDRLVNRIYIPKYFRGSQYPQYIEIPYPKAGVEENPLVTLYIWKVSTKKSVIIEPPVALMKMNQ